MSKDSDATSTSQVTLPPYLLPLVGNATDVSGRALANLEQRLSGNRTAPRNTFLEQSDLFANLVATGGDGSIPLLRRTLQETADPTRIAALLPSSLDVASQIATGPGGEGDALADIRQFRDSLGVPSQSLATADNALRSSAQGNFLLSNPDMRAAIQAEMNQILPQIDSTFSAAGGGALSGGLAETARTQAVSDSFARLFNQERDRQQAAATTIGNLGLGMNEQRLQANDLLGSTALNRDALRLNATNPIFNLMDSERARQLNAASQLPQVGLLQSQISRGVGNDILNFQQDQLDRDTNNLFNLYNAGLSLLPIGSLSGQVMTQPMQRNAGAGVLGGGLAGAQLASLIPGIGPALGAVGGGLLGGFF